MAQVTLKRDICFTRVRSTLLNVFQKLKTVLELYNVEIHQKKAGPDYHRWKTMVKRSIEQNLRNEEFWGQKWKF